jgi:hypothetical protein
MPVVGASQPTPADRIVGSRRPWVVGLGLAFFVLVTRLPAILSPKAIDDEQVYSVVAETMLHGGRPYVDAIERKPPLLFALYEGIFAVAGDQNWIALHLVAALWTLATMAGLYLIARRLFDAATGFWAALLYGVFVAWADYRNLALNGELLMNLPVVLALAVTLAPSRTRLRPELLVAGALVAIGSLLKQPAGIAGLPLGLYLLHPDYRRRRSLAWRHAIGQGFLLTLGFLATFALTGWVLWQEGLLKEALRWVVFDHAVPPGTGTRLFLEHGPASTLFFALSALPLLLATGRSLAEGARGQGYWAGLRAEFFALMVLLLVSAIGVAINVQFLYHYYLQLIPPLALLAAPVFAAAVRGESRGWITVLSAPRLIGWVGATALVFLVVDTIGIEQHRSPALAAMYVREHSSITDRIFIWGQGVRQTGMYLDARRLPASRFIASFPLTGHVFGIWDPNFDSSNRVSPAEWQDLLADFGRHPPRYIIDTDAASAKPIYPIAHYPVLRDYLAANFREVYRASDGVVYERRPAGPGN